MITDRYIVTLRLPAFRIKMIEIIRAITEWSLKDAKDFVDMNLYIDTDLTINPLSNSIDKVIELTEAEIGRLCIHRFNLEKHNHYPLIVNIERIRPDGIVRLIKVKDETF